ncbi:hypothetical protein PBT90_10645 [Algoriphagus halophytocola]|uniref:Uncharacterized protein n=1 Tax=Algoriphagus halophytocola TaxID=2991499 RepID=A0ABY6ML46_9BACT|nr:MULTISPECIES: hypothetical protein [unclassified Algoriphagus]UZD23845.1 hypothetical protein OM944_04965 [Algoriphagus sp. TR-M5]WBL41214.1 hypothetical protein PBT90_10645 [Algoriphagus sp. TR-M9]
MQEIWSLTIPNSKNPNSEVLKQTLKENQKDLGIFLSYYFKKEGALAEKVDLASEITFNDPETGSFNLEFDLIHFNACLAIHEQKREQLKITFEIQGKQFILKGPYWPEREMDEI